MPRRVRNKHDLTITSKIIERVHFILSDFRRGADLVNFISATEPILTQEIYRLINSEIKRMRHILSDAELMYYGSMLGAAYLAGFMVSREASHDVFDSMCSGKVARGASLNDFMSIKDIDAIIDTYRAQGKSYDEIGRCMAQKQAEMLAKEQEPETKSNAGKKLNIEGLQ